MLGMARSIRIEYAGAFYHVMALGNRRELIFQDDEDRQGFLKVLAEACEKTGWRVHAWVLMSNHYHLLVQTPEPNLVAGMGWLQNTYARRFNTRHKFWGRLFGDRYKAVLVEGRGYHYETLLDYIHLNPVRAKLVDIPAGQSVLDYPWSSVAAGYALLPSRRPKWLAAEEGLQAFGCADTTKGRRAWVKRLDQRAQEEARESCGVPTRDTMADARKSNLRHGWYWGTQAFAEQALKFAEGVLRKPRHRNYRTSDEQRAHGEAQAREKLASGLKQAGLTLKGLAALPGSDPRKVAIAHTIRKETTMSLGWIAEHLAMKSAANVSQQLFRHRLRSSSPVVP